MAADRTAMVLMDGSPAGLQEVPDGYVLSPETASESPGNIIQSYLGSCKWSCGVTVSKPYGCER
ncbi:Hypothetical protein FKW44_008354 [Caligus rogercresseyi]|uniref:Uncharacterized protein n=1 Tax=Caligus rogercresseyi TaxID=217165 RepID=A0A7T8KFZ0_CALRO|nr:Hypothetical protein FKW44_008354 [Caligus rogercresseyi]